MAIGRGHMISQPLGRYRLLRCRSWFSERLAVLFPFDRWQHIAVDAAVARFVPSHRVVHLTIRYETEVCNVGSYAIRRQVASFVIYLTEP